MRINKFILLLSILGLFYVNNAYGDGCKYRSEILECHTANTNGTVKSIEDFVCITGSNEEITYQIVLDKQFSELDDEMDTFIENLERNKDTYFGINREKTYIDGINDIHSKSDYFLTEYKKLCGMNIINEVVECLDGGDTSIKNATNFFREGECMGLVNKKIEIFNDVTYAILMLNKKQIKADEKKLYDQGQRKNYDVLLDIMMINIGYISRIFNKWPSRLANPHGS